MIDTSQFGSNLFRSRVAQERDVLTFSQRGWLFGLCFAIIAAVIAGVLFANKTRFSGGGAIGYSAAIFFILVAVLYTTYVHEISFDVPRRRLLVKKGFMGFVKSSESEFQSITSIALKEHRITSNEEHVSTRTVSMWDIGVHCLENQPTFDFWRTDDKKTALHIAKTIAHHVGCAVDGDIS